MKDDIKEAKRLEKEKKAANCEVGEADPDAGSRPVPTPARVGATYKGRGRGRGKGRGRGRNGVEPVEPSEPAAAPKRAGRKRQAEPSLPDEAENPEIEGAGAMAKRAKTKASVMAEKAKPKGKGMAKGKVKGKAVEDVPLDDQVMEASLMESLDVEGCADVASPASPLPKAKAKAKAKGKAKAMAKATAKAGAKAAARPKAKAKGKGKGRGELVIDDLSELFPEDVRRVQTIKASMTESIMKCAHMPFDVLQSTLLDGRQANSIFELNVYWTRTTCGLKYTEAPGKPQLVQYKFTGNPARAGNWNVLMSAAFLAAHELEPSLH